MPETQDPAQAGPQPPARSAWSEAWASLDRSPGRGLPRGAGEPEVVEPGARPVTEAVHRRAVHLTAPQSDALAGLLAARRLTELYGLRNGTVVARFAGSGYLVWRAYITTDGRVLEDEDASRVDADREADGPLIIARDEDRLRLGLILPRIDEQAASKPRGASANRGLEESEHEDAQGRPRDR